MKHERVFFQEPDAYLDTYFLDFSESMPNSVCRPLVLICPGGGYRMTSDREAEPIALSFAARGFHAAVLRYPVAPARFPVALCALAKAVAYLRAHAEANHIDPDRIAVSGYSAGGHLAASLGVFWNCDWLEQQVGGSREGFRPNCLLLGYPVITSGEFAHAESFERLLGMTPEPTRLEEVSLENHISSNVPPTFLWHTYTDELVPVENSLLFAQGLRKVGVEFELHIYSTGEHGLSLANDITMDRDGNRVCQACTGWIDLACAWLWRVFDDSQNAKVYERKNNV